MSTGAPRVTIVGAGIVGSAIALALARRGAAVWIVDAGGARASEASFGWINASWFNRPDYFRLRHFSMQAWRRWARDVPGLAPRWSGGLLWELDDAGLDAFAAGHAAMGYAVRLVGRDEIRRLEPSLADPPGRAALALDEGWIDAGAAADAIRAAATAAGARLHAGRVAAVEPGALRLADGTGLAAERIVVAAGAGAAALLGLPVTPVPGLMALTTPARRPLAHVLTTPEIMLRPDDTGGILAGAEAGGSEIDRDPEAVAGDLVAKVRALVAEPGLALERIVVGRRPMPADEHPLVGAVPDRPGVHAAVMHSGVTLAPGVAELVAQEILEDAEAPLLAPFRPDRPDRPDHPLP